MMKRILALGIALTMLMGLSLPSFAENIAVSEAGLHKIKTGSSILVEDICTFTIKSTTPYDVFMNTESGDAMDFLVVTFDIINWMTEPLFLRTQMKSSLEYDGSFVFKPAYLWANPQGRYYEPIENRSIYVYSMDVTGTISASSSSSGGYIKPAVQNNYDRFYYPEVDAFIRDSDVSNTDQAFYFQCTDGSKTAFDPLVQRTMHYVFKVPNIVAKDEGLRVLTLSIGGSDYQLTF